MNQIGNVQRLDPFFRNQLAMPTGTIAKESIFLGHLHVGTWEWYMQIDSNKNLTVKLTQRKV